MTEDTGHFADIPISQMTPDEYALWELQMHTVEDVALAMQTSPVPERREAGRAVLAACSALRRVAAADCAEIANAIQRTIAKIETIAAPEGADDEPEPD